VGSSIRETCVTEVGGMRSKVGGVGEVGVMGIVAQVVGVSDGSRSGGDGGRSSMDGGNGGGDGSNVMGNGLGDMVSQSVGLEQGLVIGSLGLNNWFLCKDRLMFNDGVGDMLGGGDCAGNNLGNSGGFMNIGGFSNGVSQSGDLRGHLGKSMSLSHGISEVTAQTVRFN